MNTKTFLEGIAEADKPTLSQACNEAITRDASFRDNLKQQVKDRSDLNKALSEELALAFIAQGVSYAFLRDKYNKLEADYKILCDESEDVPF